MPRLAFFHFLNSPFGNFVLRFRRALRSAALPCVAIPALGVLCCLCCTWSSPSLTRSSLALPWTFPVACCIAALLLHTPFHSFISLSIDLSFPHYSLDASFFPRSQLFDGPAHRQRQRPPARCPPTRSSTPTASERAQPAVSNATALWLGGRLTRGNPWSRPLRLPPLPNGPGLVHHPVASHAPEITPGLEEPACSPPPPPHTAPTPTALVRPQTPATDAALSWRIAHRTRHLPYTDRNAGSQTCRSTASTRLPSRKPTRRLSLSPEDGT